MTQEAIFYSLGKNTHDNIPEQRCAENFDAFEAHIRSTLSMKKGEFYFCAGMNTGEHHDRARYPLPNTYRLAALAKPKRFICLDHDGYSSPEIFQMLVEDLKAYRGFIYETWSSTPDNPRARIVIHTDRELSRDESFALCEEFDCQLISMYGVDSIKTDPSVYRPEQPCYCPGSSARITSLTGDPIRVGSFLPPLDRSEQSKENSRAQNLLSARKSQRYQLSHSSLLQVLNRIDPFPEPNWFKVAIILARELDEDGRAHFLSFSQGAYWHEPYPNFSPQEANAKYDRALREKSRNNNQAGIRALLQMAGLSPSDVEFEKCLATDVNGAVSEDQKALNTLIKEFSLIDLGGQVRVIRNEEVAALKANALKKGVSMYQKKDAELIMRRTLVAKNLPQAPAQINAFFIHPDTRIYESTAFHPLPQKPNVLNYWRDPLPPTLGGSYTRVVRFLQEVICAGNNEIYTYLLNFLAHMLQKPEVKPGVAIILLGGQGTGKGTFFRLLEAIWKSSVLVVQDIDQVLGRFNSALERSYVVCMDEAMFRGDRKASERLKALVTEPVIRIEEKYEPARTIESFHRFFAATNNNHFGQVDVDDRRYLFLRVSDRRRCDHAYFSDLHSIFNDETAMSAFVHELRMRDLNTVNIFAQPISEEHTLQRIQSFQGFVRFWHDYLVREQVSRDGTFISTDVLTQEYKNYNSREDQFAPLQSNELSKQLQQMCPHATRERSASTHNHSKRGYNLPPLSVCRADFEEYVGVKIDWDECPGEQPKYSHPF
jgi:hypothetical protein